MWWSIGHRDSTAEPKRRLSSGQYRSLNGAPPNAQSKPTSGVCSTIHPAVFWLRSSSHTSSRHTMSGRSCPSQAAISWRRSSQRGSSSDAALSWTTRSTVSSIGPF